MTDKRNTITITPSPIMPGLHMDSIPHRLITPWNRGEHNLALEPGRTFTEMDKLAMWSDFERRMCSAVEGVPADAVKPLHYYSLEMVRRPLGRLVQRSLGVGEGLLEGRVTVYPWDPDRVAAYPDYHSANFDNYQGRIGLFEATTVDVSGYCGSLVLEVAYVTPMRTRPVGTRTIRKIGGFEISTPATSELTSRQARTAARDTSERDDLYGGSLRKRPSGAVIQHQQDWRKR